jgi:hypothetical protein
MLQITYQAALTIVGNFLAHVTGGNFSGTFYGSYLMLYTARDKTTPDLTLADLTEANFTGYARQPLTALGAPYLSDDNRAAQDFQAINFQSTDNAHPNTVVGMAIVSANVGGNVLAYEEFAAPILFANAGNGATVLPRIELPPTADWGETLTAM